jgi:hypothetical protein
VRLEALLMEEQAAAGRAYLVQYDEIEGRRLPEVVSIPFPLPQPHDLTSDIQDTRGVSCTLVWS